MRFQLDPASPNGISVVPEQTVFKQSAGFAVPGPPGQVQSIVAGTNVTVNSTDPANPVINATSSGSVTSVTAGDSTITIGGTAPAPTVAVNAIAESKVIGLVSDLAAKVTANGAIAGATVGDATHIPVITYDSKGLITSSTTATISSGTQRTFVTAMGF